MKKLYKKLKSILLIVSLVFPLQFISQTTVTIGTGTTSSYYYGPLYRSSSASSWDYSHHGYVYTAAELGIPSGSTITSIQFQRSDSYSTSGSSNEYQIYMENSSATTVAVGTFASWVTGATSVYNNSSYNFAGSTGWYTINLTTPFSTN